MGLNEDFKQAATDVLNLKERPDNNTLLKLYGLFKQGSEGDVHGSRPGMLDIKGRKKFDSWSELKGLEKEEAQKKYIDLVQKLSSTKS